MGITLESMPFPVALQSLSCTFRKQTSRFHLAVTSNIRTLMWNFDNAQPNCRIYVFIYLFYLLVSPYYNTQNYNKNKNNIHDYRQGDRNSVSQLLRVRIRTYKHKKKLSK